MPESLIFPLESSSLADKMDIDDIASISTLSSPPLSPSLPASPINEEVMDDPEVLEPKPLLPELLQPPRILFRELIGSLAKRKGNPMNKLTRYARVLSDKYQDLEGKYHDLEDKYHDLQETTADLKRGIYGGEEHKLILDLQTLRLFIRYEHGPLEELEHPWLTFPVPHASGHGMGMVYRVTDSISRSPLRDEGFFSDVWDCDLYSFKGRKSSLEDHVHWSRAKLTPFISCTTSFEEVIRRIQVLLERDSKTRAEDREAPPCSVVLHCIDATLCHKLGWPIINMKREIENYEIEIPEHKVLEDYDEEYIFPLQISARMVVGSWNHEAIKSYMDVNECDIKKWHDDVAIPAFEKHEYHDSDSDRAESYEPEQ
ncbi:uncharacterized protein BP5553_05745 [Venustampulla echinocandica]|uniref:DUF7587 domain-containing protein n=1 Tax=Venustampulla echinocandica TaxID=2656787 RepID=A0A370TLJ3_9HELO|nr:uncharacterized protein BP5553_05745 [Venustampulla echinocandica]RDL36393.1 hypothetical protein BP5553_05745 [Venustampulla echinocandica]